MKNPENIDNMLYQYNVGVREIIQSVRVSDEIALGIYNRTERYLQSSNEEKIYDDRANLLEYINNWLTDGVLVRKELKKFFDSIVKYFRTKSAEVSRNIIAFFSKEKELFLIHTREDVRIINVTFDEIVTVGLSKENILRAFKFYFSDELNEIALRYREKHRAKVLLRLFNIESITFDYSSIIRISCTNSNRNMTYQISLSPMRFMEYYKDGVIEINPTNQTIIPPQELMDIVSLKVKNKTFSKKNISDFLTAIKKEFDNPIIEKIEEYLTEYKAKRIELKIDLEKYGLERFITEESQDYKIIEHSERIEFIVNEKHEFIAKPRVDWGTLIMLDEDINLSNKFLESLEYEILKGSSIRRINFVQLMYMPEPLKIGNFLIFNLSDLKYSTNLIQILQNEFETKYDPSYKVITLLIQLSLLKTSDIFQYEYLADNLIKKIISKERIILNRGIEEDFILEFKGGEFFNTHSRQDEIAHYITEKIQPKLTNSNIVAIIFGYDEVSDTIQPISYNNYKNEERDELQQKIKEILREEYTFNVEHLIINIYLLNQNEEEGLLLVVSGNSAIDNGVYLESLFTQ